MNVYAAYKATLNHPTDCDCGRCLDSLDKALHQLARSLIQGEVAEHDVNAADLFAMDDVAALAQAVRLTLAGDYIAAGEILKRALLAEIEDRAELRSRKLRRSDLPVNFVEGYA